MQLSDKKTGTTPQIKICGITRIEEALGCAELGVDAIGCVFFPKSPRNLTGNQARTICNALNKNVKKIGVFVDESFATIMRNVEKCGLSGVQLHGREPVELVHRLGGEGLTVIKALFVDGIPSLDDAEKYPASAFLVECSKGLLPGGNA